MQSGKQISQLLTEYVDNTTKIHRNRIDSLVQANQILQKEYLTIQEQLKTLASDNNTLNKDVDDFINTFGVIDEIEENIKRTQQNIDVIFYTISNLGRKISELRKNKKN